MMKFNYIIKSFVHYLKANLLVALGVAVSTMVLTGSLIIGDSVRYSLEQANSYRLGEMTHLAAVSERYFRQELSEEIGNFNQEILTAPVLLLEGVVVAGGGEQRINRVQVVGINNQFGKIAKSAVYSDLKENEIIISRNLADRLNVAEGDNILVRIKKASLMPMNAPFVGAEETSVSMRATIKDVVEKEQMSRFSLKTSQTAPYNLFLSIDRLNNLMEFKGKANHLLISTFLNMEDVKKAVAASLIPADAGLKMKYIEASGEIEISTERVFMEPRVAHTLEQVDEANPIITYFVNAIARDDTLNAIEDDKNKEEHNNEIPYSFVSTLGNNRLSGDEIILTQWAADDLGVKPGDRIKLKYLEIGPLRQLINRESDFILKEIVPMSRVWADSTRMPWLPGLSDAGHCREWEAGVPINLENIRKKDEKYWEEWKGAPKAYISIDKAREIWKNRFGIYTAVRFPSETFVLENYLEAFSQNIVPGDLGISVEPIRERGIRAAQNGTDFSGLFLGLSIFILAASVILTALLFRFNMETRSAEVGLLTALGFREKQVRTLFLWEGFAVALSGGITGLILSVFYTSGIFRILNTLWYDIVRTDVLLIKISPISLILGLIISLLVSLGVIYLSVYRFQLRKTAELQKRVGTELKNKPVIAINILIWIFLAIPLILTGIQLIQSDILNPVLFFISGGLLLAGMLLAFRNYLLRMQNPQRGKIRLEKLARLNLSRNRNRSLTVVTLFALGTFLVISTGSYKLDLFEKARDKSSGTGGYLFFAETTMPVLYNLNDQGRRAEAGIREDFTAVQFRLVEGDDASCLNLNRIEQPAILGVNPEDLAGRFTFASQLKGLQTEDPWLLLNELLDDGTVPAIADQTVIQWGLGKKIGDVLLYQNEQGDTLRLKLIAGTIPSIFQGYIIISNNHFLKNYPSSSGSYIFLIDGDRQHETQIGEELSSAYRDFGWEMQSTANRLVEFYSVTNTYLSIFLALGALGMILGTFGLAVILARSILERKREIAVMQAVGFNKRYLFGLLVKEYFFLLMAGVFTGFIAAVVATFPSFFSSNTDASFSTVALITGIIVINGILWISLLSWFSLSGGKLITSLTVE